MMCVKKSNKWARWKLVFLLPLAACTLYAFARPDVNRQFEQLIPSESTTILPDNKQIPPEMINNEMNTKVNSLPERERLNWLQANNNMIILMVNSRADILYNNKFVDRKQLPAKLSESLRANYNNTKPILLYCLYDRGTPASALDSIRQIVINEAKQHKAAIHTKRQEVYIYEGDPHLFESGQKGSPVIVTFYEDNEPSTSLAIYSDNTIKVESAINKKGLENVSFIQIKAPQDTPMGKIADIKEAIRQLWEENGLDATRLQFMYRIQQMLPAS